MRSAFIPTINFVLEAWVDAVQDAEQMKEESLPCSLAPMHFIHERRPEDIKSKLAERGEGVLHMRMSTGVTVDARVRVQRTSVGMSDVSFRMLSTCLLSTANRLS